MLGIERASSDERSTIDASGDAWCSIWLHGVAVTRMSDGTDADSSSAIGGTLSGPPSASVHRGGRHDR